MVKFGELAAKLGKLSTEIRGGGPKTHRRLRFRFSHSQMPFSEGVPRAALKIPLEVLCQFDGFKRGIENDPPGFKLCSVGALARVVICQPTSQVRSRSSVVLRRVGDAL